MDDLKYSVLSHVREEPVLRADLLADVNKINQTNKILKELVGAGLIRQSTGRDSFEITNAGIVAVEEEDEKRSAAQRESSRFAQQLVELQRIADAAKEDAAAAKLLSEVAQKEAGKADIKGRIAVLISVFGLLVELAVNWDKLLEVFGNIASAFRQLLAG